MRAHTQLQNIFFYFFFLKQPSLSEDIRREMRADLFSTSRATWPMSTHSTFQKNEATVHPRTVGGLRTPLSNRLNLGTFLEQVTT